LPNLLLVGVCTLSSMSPSFRVEMAAASGALVLGGQQPSVGAKCAPN